MTADSTSADPTDAEATSVEVDAGKCCGYGNCVLVAPELFDLDPDTNLAVVIAGAPIAQNRELLLSASRQCPTDAITVRG